MMELESAQRWKTALEHIVKSNVVNFESPEQAQIAMDTVDFWKQMYNYVYEVACEGLGVPKKGNANDNNQ